MKENKNKFVKFGVFFIILFIIGFIGLNITKLINYNLKIENGNFLEVDIISLVDTIIHFIELMQHLSPTIFLSFIIPHQQK